MCSYLRHQKCTSLAACRCFSASDLHVTQRDGAQRTFACMWMWATKHYDLVTVYTLIRHANTSSKDVGVTPNLRRLPLDVQGLIFHGFIFFYDLASAPGRVQSPQIILIRFSRGRDSLLHHRFGGSYRKGVQCMTRWWFRIFFLFTPIWGNDPISLIFFKGVGSTTN